MSTTRHTTAQPGRTRLATSPGQPRYAADSVARTARLALTLPGVVDARREALFASGLPRSDTLTPEAVEEAIRHTVQRLGAHGCTGKVAQEFGDYPESAAERMRWVRHVIALSPWALLNQSAAA